MPEFGSVEDFCGRYSGAVIPAGRTVLGHFLPIQARSVASIDTADGCRTKSFDGLDRE